MGDFNPEQYTKAAHVWVFLGFRVQGLGFRV
jgi:hypothetical protein